MKRNGMLKKRWVILISLLVILCLGVGAFIAQDYLNKKNTISSDETKNQMTEDIVKTENGTYKYNYNLKNYLFLGVDQNEKINTKLSPGFAGQTDCVVILSVDSSTEKAKILQISRDTMTDIDLYDMKGNRYETIYAQLALQFAYCIGAESSCIASKKTVSELINNIYLNGYIALNMNGIPKLNDALGGITLTLDDDWTEIDPSYKKGATITLEGDAAEKFVRYRDINEFASNNRRMNRQMLYIREMINALNKKSGTISNLYNFIYPKISDYMLSDLTGDEMNDFLKYDLSNAEIYYAPGEIKEGTDHEEFYLNQTEWKQMLLDVFYIKQD